VHLNSIALLALTILLLYESSKNETQSQYIKVFYNEKYNQSNRDRTNTFEIIQYWRLTEPLGQLRDNLKKIELVQFISI
jgi:hypothetical protein